MGRNPKNKEPHQNSQERGEKSLSSSLILHLKALCAVSDTPELMGPPDSSRIQWWPESRLGINPASRHSPSKPLCCS